MSPSSHGPDHKTAINSQLQRQQHDSAADSAWLKTSERTMGVPSRQSAGSTASASGHSNRQATQSPKIELDRTNDVVYNSTTAVVRSVMAMSREINDNKQPDLVELVKHVGTELRALLTHVDDILQQFPVEAHATIKMAHKVLGSDMNKLVAAMKLAHKYLNTTMSDQYTKGMLEASHALAMNAKSLLDAVDSARLMLISSDQAAH